MLKPVGDCEKGELARNLPPSHLTTDSGDYCQFQTEISSTPDEKGIALYEYKELPGLREN